MPIFEYKCAVCGGTFESLSRATNPAKAPSCPTCGSERVERILSVFARQTEGKSDCGSTVGGFR
jgi:putative FmdB family regulatory protein